MVTVKVINRAVTDAVHHSSCRDMSISGVGGHIAISVCPSLSQSFGDTFFELAVVETWITIILILDPLCQHERKISPVSKKSIDVWLHAYRLPVHRLATSLLHFVPTAYPGSHETIFYYSKAQLRAFFIPNSIRGWSIIITYRLRSEVCRHIVNPFSLYKFTWKLIHSTSTNVSITLY